MVVSCYPTFQFASICILSETIRKLHVFIRRGQVHDAGIKMNVIWLHNWRNVRNRWWKDKDDAIKRLMQAEKIPTPDRFSIFQLMHACDARKGFSVVINHHLFLINSKISFKAKRRCSLFCHHSLSSKREKFPRESLAKLWALVAS